MELGTPLEDTLDKAMRNTPSQKFRRILFQISNALKIGIDVTGFLEAVLDEIAEEEIIEIQKYGKKLNSLTMFYMLFGIVIPSLGLTMAVIIASMVSIQIDIRLFLVMIVLLLFFQLMFLSVFRAIRPNINI